MRHILIGNKEFSTNFETSENILIQGENLAVLKLLLPDFKDKFKCIYIDPPYNTGRDKLNDTFGTHYTDSLEHDVWLTMMNERIVLLKDFLTVDGTLFIQIDDNEFARLYLLMTEIFGNSNVKTVCVKMAEPTGVKMRSVVTSGGIPRLKEYLIIAQKSGIKNLAIERVPKKKWDKEYRFLITGISHSSLMELKSILNDPDATSGSMIQKANNLASKIRLESNLNLLYDKYPRLKEKDKIKIKFENAWRIVRDVSTSITARKLADEQKEKFAQDCFVILTSRGRKYLIKKNYDAVMEQPRIRLLFADDYLTYHPGDFWEDIKTTGLDKEGGLPFRMGKKPEALMKRVISMSTVPGDMVLDIFAGSGTTGAVAHKMGRKWVMVERENHVYSHIIPRLNRVISGEDKSGVSKVCGFTGGGGFRFYEYQSD